MNAILHSTGLYSTWCYFPALDMLWDIGPGAVERIRKDYGEPANIKHVFISHGHLDHLADLLTLVNTRHLAELNRKRQPLTVYHSEPDRDISRFRQLIRESYPQLNFDLKFVAIKPGDVVEVGQKWVVRAFRVQHGTHPSSLGFTLGQARRRLKAAYAEIADTIGQKLRTLSPEEKKQYYEDYISKALVYSGDAHTMPLSEAHGADYLIHDTTFLAPHSRLQHETPTHATLDEVLAFARAAQVKQLVLGHISPRYNQAEIHELTDFVQEPYKLKFVGPHRELEITDIK